MNQNTGKETKENAWKKANDIMKKTIAICTRYCPGMNRIKEESTIEIDIKICSEKNKKINNHE